MGQYVFYLRYNNFLGCKLHGLWRSWNTEDGSPIHQTCRCT